MERVQNLSRSAFLNRYVEPNEPVIVTDAMTDWHARTRWTPGYFAQVLGDLEVQIYNDLFDLRNVATLSDYLSANFNRDADAPSTEYVRWYSRLKHTDFCWSDDAFDRLKHDWNTPYFLPDNGYLIPGCDSRGRLDAQTALFPYRGIFISGKGARTRLHRDPWTTSAILCQFYGTKELVMYRPEQCTHLMSGNRFVDIEHPDLRQFPTCGQARPAHEDTLHPGEILFIPSGWLHHVRSVTDSISITWNFILESGLERLCAHLLRQPAEPEIDVIRFFLPEAGAGNLSAAQIVAALRGRDRSGTTV